MTEFDQVPDEVLADRATDGDRRAFAALVRRYGSLLRGYAIRILGTEVASDDVVQEALITAWQQLSGLDDRTAVRAWLIRITTRKALDHVRSSRVHDDIDDHDPAAASSEDPAHLAETGALDVELTRVLDTLPEVQRRSWLMQHIGGYSYDEIAAELGLPVSTIRGALSRTRRTLLDRLDGWRAP